jgi:hypothetical protein
LAPNNSFKPNTNRCALGVALIQALALRSSGMAIWKRTAFGAGLVALSVLGAGYLTAWLSLAPCSDETFRELQRQRISGTDMLGSKVALTRDSVTAKVAGPFLVETRYMVPYDLHGSLHFTRYLALPWGHFARSSEVVHLVGAPAPSGRLSANNSFKPKPLRGSA